MYRIASGGGQATSDEIPAKETAVTERMEVSEKENLDTIDIWRDTNEDKRRQEWIAVAKHKISVRDEMNNWKPRTRQSAKRMKQTINQIRLDVSRTWGTHSAYSTVSPDFVLA